MTLPASLLNHLPWLAVFEADTLAALSHDCITAFNAIATQRGLCNAAGLPLRAVPQAELPTGEAYESFIYHTGQIPTRTNPQFSSADAWHDTYNALIWLHFPRTKALLNHYQSADIAAQGITPHRSGVRNALTLFDENALIVCGNAAGQAALAAHDWQNLLCQRRGDWRDDWQQDRLRDNLYALPSSATHLFAIPFGHALLCKLRAPYKAITGHVVWLDTAKYDVNPQQLDSVDTALCLWLKSKMEIQDTEIQETENRKNTGFSSKDFLHLPVLGIPGWCADNEGRSFYDDAAVFRPLR